MIFFQKENNYLCISKLRDTGLNLLIINAIINHTKNFVPLTWSTKFLYGCIDAENLDLYW